MRADSHLSSLSAARRPLRHPDRPGAAAPRCVPATRFLPMLPAHKPNLRSAPPFRSELGQITADSGCRSSTRSPIHSFPFLTPSPRYKPMGLTAQLAHPARRLPHTPPSQAAMDSFSHASAYTVRRRPFIFSAARPHPSLRKQAEPCYMPYPASPVAEQWQHTASFA